MPLYYIIPGLLLLVVLSVKKVNPFLSLLIAAICTGLAAGMVPAKLFAALESGIGSTLGGSILVLALGAALGKVLEKSGAATAISEKMMLYFGPGRIQWAVMGTSFLIGLPLFYNAGFILLIPFLYSILRRTGLPVLYLALPMASALSITHALLPPHPGPMALVSIFGASTGITLLYGLVIAVPAAILAGPVMGSFFRHGEKFKGVVTEADEIQTKPGSGFSLAVALLPIFLIATGSIVELILGKEVVPTWLYLLSHPALAMLISLFMAVFFLGCRPVAETMKWVTEGIESVALIILIIAAGGAYKQVLLDAGAGNYFTALASSWSFHPLVFGWMMAAVIRICIGSATVAALTAAGLVFPLAGSQGVSPELMVLAIGSGSIFFSHFNDSGFWMFKEFFNLTPAQTLRSWTVMESLVSLMGLGGVLLMNMIIR
ncbi:MAG: hypothetical protein IPN29_18390 [Saprospiraceae bacterium]|nr:hypothetical protein [Saprospiraceae bacterium]